MPYTPYKTVEKVLATTVLLLVYNTLHSYILTSLHVGFAANGDSNTIALYKGTANNANRSKDDHATNSCTGSTRDAFCLLLSQLAHS